MKILSVEKREYRAFLSHSSKDKTVADKIYYWLTDVAGMHDKEDMTKSLVWYDKDEIFGGDAFIKNLENGIQGSRSLILLWSKNASESTWVRRELDHAYNHQVQFPEFRIIPIQIDDTPFNGFLSQTQAIDMPKGEMSLSFCFRLLRAMYPNEDTKSRNSNKDIYVSYGWHEPEQPFVKHISRYFMDADFRLIGDAEDQKHFTYDPKLDSKSQAKLRIQNIMLSTGGFVGIVPYRSDPKSALSGNTSSYILDEIEWAIEMGLPTVIVKDPKVIVDQGLLEKALHVVEIPLSGQIDQIEKTQIDIAVHELNEHYLREAKKAHYAFYATRTGRQFSARNRAILEIVPRITKMPCKIGEQISGTGVYQIIINQIKNAFVMIADLTDSRPNILIESGIAIGANVDIYYVQSGEQHRPPVMLGNPEPTFYTEDYELLGIIHKLVYPNRRKVLNSEFK